MKKLSQEQMSALREKLGKKGISPLAAVALEGISEADIKKAIEAKADISEYSLELVMKVILCEFSADILFSLVKNGYELNSEADCLMVMGIISRKLPENLIYKIVDSGYYLSDNADSMLIRETISGRLPEKVLRYMLEKKYTFSNINWEAMFESGIDFMVDAYIKEFYPDVKI